MKTKWKKTGVIVLAAVVVLGALAATSFYRVGQGEEALVLTFGRVTDTRGPGLYWKIPLIQSVISESVTTIHTKEYGFRTTRTGSAGTAATYADEQDESVMLQGEIALHSGDVAVGETDPAYGGYGAPEGDPIQGDIMLISADEAKTTEARYTVKGLLGRQVLYTARQEGRVLTLDVPDCAATFRTTIQDMKTLMDQGVSTLVLTTEKGSTTLNLSLLCEGQSDTQRVVLRQLGDSAFLTVGLRCRRDLIVGR